MPPAFGGRSGLAWAKTHVGPVAVAVSAFVEPERRPHLVGYGGEINEHIRREALALVRLLHEPDFGVDAREVAETKTADEVVGMGSDDRYFVHG